MAPEPISTAYFINASQQLYVYMYMLLGKGSVKCIPSIIARQRHVKHVLSSTNTRNNTKKCWSRVSVYPHIASRQQLGKDVPTATKNRGVVSYVVRVLSKESRR
jgi:hypothetical protein